MSVWLDVGSTRLAMTPAGPRVAALVRTVEATAILDLNQPVTTIALALARRLPDMPAVVPGGVVALRHPLHIKLRRSYRAITALRYAGDLPAGATLIVGRDVLEQEPLALDFAAGRIATVDGRPLAQRYTPLALTVRDDGYAIVAGAEVVPFRTMVTSAATPNRTVRFGDTMLPIHDDGNGRRWFGWDSLAGGRIVLDLRHKTIWIGKASA